MNSYFDLSLKNQKNSPGTQHYFGHGKLLLSGEYLILDGADGLALPTKAGQSMSVRYESSFSPKLCWKSYDYGGECWFEAEYEFWNFDYLGENPSPEVLRLQALLRQIRKQNNHFLRENVNIQVETKLGFSRKWGLGSSSTLIYNLAQWGYVSPFELLFKTNEGSGYDVACAQSNGPIIYKKGQQGPIYSPVSFNPSFKENLYFLYLGKKQNTSEAIGNYQKIREQVTTSTKEEISEITRSMVNAKNIKEFGTLINQHEQIVSKVLNIPTVKNSLFQHFPGEVKSLGAWGGDFALVSSEMNYLELQKYFVERNYEYLINYSDIILENSMLGNGIGTRIIH